MGQVGARMSQVGACMLFGDAHRLLPNISLTVPY